MKFKQNSTGKFAIGRVVFLLGIKVFSLRRRLLQPTIFSSLNGMTQRLKRSASHKERKVISPSPECKLHLLADNQQ